MSQKLTIRDLGTQDYLQTYQDMQAFTQQRIELKLSTKQEGASYDRLADELWLVEHPDVYTLGLAGKREHILTATSTPVVKTDRGGQVTWHGQGQLVAYLLYDLNALGWHVRKLIDHAEALICQTLNPIFMAHNLVCKPIKQAPGVYVFERQLEGVNLTNHHSTNHHSTNYNLTNHLGKVASLGFKIRHGFSYHGIAINVCANLSAFDAINPCGYKGLNMVNTANFLTEQFSSVPMLKNRLVKTAQMLRAAY